MVEGKEEETEELLDDVSAREVYWPLRPQSAWRREVARTIYLIEEQEGKGASLERLAAEVGLSACRLSRVFADEIGLPPYRYACHLRLVRAKRLMLEGMSLASAAHDAGFFDQAHFTRCFTKRFGFSPARYLAEMRPASDMRAA